MALHVTPASAGSGFEDFHTEARDGALRLATLLRQRRDGAEDIVQDAFTEVFRRRDRTITPAPICARRS